VDVRLDESAGTRTAEPVAAHISVERPDRARDLPQDRRAHLRAAIADCVAASPHTRPPAGPRLPLSVPAYDADDIYAAVETLLDGWPTLGPTVSDVEARLARYLGARNAIMVSSGGAANLLTLMYATSPFARAPHRLAPGDEVIVPAVAWSTTVTPLLACGCVPVFADSEPGGLNVDVQSLERLVGPRTKAVVVVHCLGTACDLDALVAFCDRDGLLLIEDSCEALGTRWRGRHVGGFGAFGTFSFYFSHHLCAIEGGLITTPDDGAAELLRSMRANGYAPGRAGRPDNGFAGSGQQDAGGGSAFFPVAGFNFKPTAFSAALLRGQLTRLEPYVAARNAAADTYRRRLSWLEPWFDIPAAHPRCRPSWMAFPLVLREDAPFDRADVCAHLNRCGIDTRPIIGGNLAAQPFVRLYPHRAPELPRAQHVHDRGFMIGVHHGVHGAHVEYVDASLREFVTGALGTLR